MLSVGATDRRPIQYALLLSLLLHVAFLAISRSAPTLTTARDLPLDLRLWIDVPDDQLLESAKVAKVRPHTLAPAASSRASQSTAADDTAPAAGPTDLEHLSVVIKTRHNGLEFETRMQMKRLAFSHFTQLVDKWDTGVQLHDDVIRGRFHSNSEILLGWDSKAAPRFFGEVTSAAQRYRIVTESYTRVRRDIFPDGINVRAAAIELPKLKLPLLEDTDPWNSQRRHFAADTQIIFHGDGSFTWRASAGARQGTRDSARVFP